MRGNVGQNLRRCLILLFCCTSAVYRKLLTYEEVLLSCKWSPDLWSVQMYLWSVQMCYGLKVFFYVYGFIKKYL